MLILNKKNERETRKTGLHVLKNIFELMYGYFEPILFEQGVKYLQKLGKPEIIRDFSENWKKN